jgi:ribosomal protein S18 acetylase RimI-like enzyme
VGRAAHSDGWSALSRVFVDPDFRGQGISKLVTTSLLNSAADEGVKKAVLQVDSKNTVAINLYTSLGFTFHHEYNYRTLQESLPMITEECC